MILVTGATGFLGMEICRVLVRQGKEVRAMVRKKSDQGKIFILEQMGVNLNFGDFRDPSNFDILLRDVDTVISTASAVPNSYKALENNLHMVDRVGAINLINASKRAGVEHFIYLSLSGNMDINFPLRTAKREVERYLRDSGLVFTILRSGFFMETWLSNLAGYDPASNSMKVIGDGRNPVSYVSLLDVAKFAARFVNHKAAYNRVIEVGGPQKLTQLQVIEIFEKTIGHPLQRLTIPLEDLKTEMLTSIDPKEISLSGLMYCLAKGDPVDMEKTCEKFELKLRTVADYAKCVLAEAYTYDFY